jgi:hypothetical protein
MAMTTTARVLATVCSSATDFNSATVCFLIVEAQRGLLARLGLGMIFTVHKITLQSYAGLGILKLIQPQGSYCRP